MSELLPISIIRQSAVELLGCAATQLFPAILLIDHSVNEFGFYYDFIAEHPIDDHALILIEERMRGLAKDSLEIKLVEMMRENAASFFQHQGQPFVSKRILDADENIVPIVKIGEFSDYCQALIGSSTSETGAFKLLKVERIPSFIPDEGEVYVVRIHGTAFSDSYALKRYIKALNAARKRDHVDTGEELGLFLRCDDANPYAWFWKGKGVQIKQRLIDLLAKAHAKAGFEIVSSPPVIEDSLVRKAGAYEQLTTSELPPAFTYEDRDFVIPPNFGAAHAQLYLASKHTINDLPLRLWECGTVGNFKRGGSLPGLHSSRFLTVDEGRIFCGTEQVVAQLISYLQFIDKIIKIFSFEGHWYLKGQGAKFAGTQNRWNKANESFSEAFKACGFSLDFDESQTAFSGPVVEMKLTDSLGREWRGPSIAFDFCGVDRMDLRYRDADKEMVKPVMLVTSIYGSIERLIAIMLEHDAGILTTLLATVNDESPLN